MDITIKVSDQGGGVDRVTAEKMFQYLYTTSPSPSPIPPSSPPALPIHPPLPPHRVYKNLLPSPLPSLCPTGDKCLG